jgi:hypothetical protein
VGHYPDLRNLINQIADAGVRVLLYGGDLDTILNPIHATVFASKLGRPQLGSDPNGNQPWTYAGEIPNVAGFVTKYAGGELICLLSISMS